MGYRPHPRPGIISAADRREAMRELWQERANYVFLLGEMSPLPGTTTHLSLEESIADVDARIADLNPMPPPGPGGILPPPNPRLMTKGFTA